MGQQTGVILPPTATNPRLESLQEDGKSPAIVVLCVIRRLALLWVEVLASRASVHASKPPARAAISGIVTAVPGPLRQRQPTSATKSSQSRRIPSRPSWISIGLAAIGAAIGSATIWATSALRHPASYVSTGIRTAAHSWGTVHGKYGSYPGVEVRVRSRLKCLRKLTKLLRRRDHPCRHQHSAVEETAAVSGYPHAASRSPRSCGCQFKLMQFRRGLL